LKIVLDTNIVLDVLLEREPFASLSINLFNAVEQQVIQGYLCALCATTITTIDYLLTKSIGKQSAKVSINQLLNLFAIAEVNDVILKAAINSDFSDFEDAVLYHSGVCAGVDGFVTRNSKDFKTASLPIYSPTELLRIMNLGTRINQITTKNLNGFKFKFPARPEQIKIANFLTTLDEKITQSQTYLETVKQYKQGLLQQMFI
jgi:restriction endonuclease S subunit